MITSSISKPSNSKIGLSWCMSSSTIQTFLTSTFLFLQAIQWSTNIFLANSWEGKRMFFFQVKLVLENLSLLEISSVEPILKPMSILLWTSLLKPVPKTCLMFSWTKTSSPKREELKSVQQEERKWYSMLTISTCLLSKNTELNLQMNY